MRPFLRARVLLGTLVNRLHTPDPGSLPISRWGAMIQLVTQLRVAKPLRRAAKTVGNAVVNGENSLIAVVTSPLHKQSGGVG